MHRRFRVVLALAVILTGTGANAQLAGLLARSFGLPADGEAGGTYQAKGQIRTYITSDPQDNSLLYEKLIDKALSMADAKGYSRIGVTKSVCTTAVVSGSPRSTSCYVIAVMLRVGEAAEPRGNRQVQYYNEESTRRGAIAPPSD